MTTGLVWRSGAGRRPRRLWLEGWRRAYAVGTVSVDGKLADGEGRGSLRSGRFGVGVGFDGRCGGLRRRLGGRRLRVVESAAVRQNQRLEGGLRSHLGKPRLQSVERLRNGGLIWRRRFAALQPSVRGPVGVVCTRRYGHSLGNTDRRRRSDSRARRALQQGSEGQERVRRRGHAVLREPEGTLVPQLCLKMERAKGQASGGQPDETNDGLPVASAWLAGVVEKGVREGRASTGRNNERECVRMRATVSRRWTTKDGGWMRTTKGVRIGEY